MESEFLDHLSRLVLGAPGSHENDWDYYVQLTKSQRKDFTALAEDHRILLRILQALRETGAMRPREIQQWISNTVAIHTAKATAFLAIVSAICKQLEASGEPVVVIKSLDHWPDLGGDFDIYTAGSEAEIEKLMEQAFAARLEERGWSDRLAHKLRFRIPGMDKLVEIHIGRLGQTGQQVRMGRMLLRNRVRKTFAGHDFFVPAPEDQILLRVMDRLYRHYCLRICDIADIGETIHGNTVDFERLKRESNRSGIRHGVCAYLAIVNQYYAHYRNEHLRLPMWVWKDARFGAEKLYAHTGLLRIPLIPQGAGLFTHELTKAIRRKDIKKSLRTGIIPALAAAASARFRITGSNKGIW